jgi:hypothetical protein
MEVSAIVFLIIGYILNNTKFSKFSPIMFFSACCFFSLYFGSLGMINQVVLNLILAMINLIGILKLIIKNK